MPKIYIFTLFTAFTKKLTGNFRDVFEGLNDGFRRNRLNKSCSFLWIYISRDENFQIFINETTITKLRDIRVNHQNYIF